MDFDWAEAYNSVLQSHQQMVENMSAIFGYERLAEEQMENIDDNTENLKELRRIADAAELRAKLAQAEAEDSKKESSAARRDARISNVIAFLSMLIALIALFK